MYRRHFSIDPTQCRVELSLKGTDVGGPDPAPKPKRMEEKERKDKEKKEQRKKRKKEKESSDQSDDETEEILKRLKTGKQFFFFSCICSRLTIATFLTLMRADSYTYQFRSRMGNLELCGHTLIG